MVTIRNPSPAAITPCCGRVAVRHWHLCLTRLQFGGCSYQATQTSGKRYMDWIHVSQRYHYESGSHDESEWIMIKYIRVYSNGLYVRIFGIISPIITCHILNVMLQHTHGHMDSLTFKDTHEAGSFREWPWANTLTLESESPYNK